MSKQLTHKSGFEVHIVSERVTEPGEPPLFEVELVLMERDANGKTGDFIMLYPTGRKWWIPSHDFGKRWGCTIMHVLKEPAKEHPVFPITDGVRALPHAASSGVTKRHALRTVEKGSNMAFDFAIAAAEGKVKMVGFDIDLENEGD